MKKITFLFFIFSYLIYNCNESGNCQVKYPKLVSKLKLEDKYKIAISDYYLSNFFISYFKKNKQENYFSVIDSSKILELVYCKVCLDTILIDSNKFVTFMFSFYKDNVKINKEEWSGSIIHSNGLKYSLENEKIIAEIYDHGNISGSGFDDDFYSNLLDSDKRQFLLSRIKKIDCQISTILIQRYQLVKQYH